jgi:hypothetical protein
VKSKIKGGFRGGTALAASQLHRDQRQLEGISIANRRQSRKVWLTAIRAIAEFAVRIAESPHWFKCQSELGSLLDEFASWARVCKNAVPDAEGILSALRKLADASEPEANSACVTRVRSILSRISAELEDVP